MLVRIQDSPRGRASTALVFGVILLGICGFLASADGGFLAVFGSGSGAVTGIVWGALVLRAFPPDRHEDEQELRRYMLIALVVGALAALGPALALAG